MAASSHVLTAHGLPTRARAVDRSATEYVGFEAKAGARGEMGHLVVDELDDFARVLNNAAGAHAFATGGLPQFLASIERARRDFSVPENPDPEMLVGVGDPNIKERTYARFRVSELPALLARGGPVDTQLGQQWAVFVYSHWEHHVRPRLARRNRIEPNDVRIALFGDLRLIRNDIVHNDGRASEATADRCELLKWFRRGDSIGIGGRQIEEFMRLIPWDQLRHLAGAR